MTKSTDNPHDTTDYANAEFKRLIEQSAKDGVCQECLFIDLTIILMINLIASKTGAKNMQLSDSIALAAFLTSNIQAMIENGDFQSYNIKEYNSHIH